MERLETSQAPCGSRIPCANPVWGVNTVPGGFDSHALPPKYYFISDSYLPSQA